MADGDLVIVHGRFSGFGAPVNWIAADILRISDGFWSNTLKRPWRPGGNVRAMLSFRTNLILCGTAEFVSVDVDVSLISPDGATLGTRRYRLPPFGMIQVSRVAREVGATGDLNGARLDLSTATPLGSFAAYASVIDNVTNDPRTLLPQ